MNASTLRSRRATLRRQFPGGYGLLASGEVQFRNITASGYPFRCSSHCLYFFGKLPPRSMALIGPDLEIIFWPFADIDHVVWEGPQPGIEAIRAISGCDDIRPLEDLEAFIAGIDSRQLSSVPALHLQVNERLERLLGRKLSLEGADRKFALALVECRLGHDAEGITELRSAAAMATEAFLQGKAQVHPGSTGWKVLAAMEATCLSKGMRPSFEPTVTTKGETLHCQDVAGELRAGELLLVDFGVETQAGYASDVTRTWPVSGQFSAEQRDIYQLVLAMQQAALALVRPGTSYFDVHLAACRVLTDGLLNLGIVQGDRDSLIERGAHTVFFPHGIGHLLGLDVHDLEDLGDLAGYEDGTIRDLRFGFKSLRLHRKLRQNMLVSVEPGFYWIPALVEDRTRHGLFREDFSVEAAKRFRSVRGIRIEDEALVTERGCELLTGDIPKDLLTLEQSL